MSYNFYSLVSSIKDKSSQAMATLSSDLKDFTAIIQEDVAEVSATVRKTVQEKSEALRQRADSTKSDTAPPPTDTTDTNATTGTSTTDTTDTTDSATTATDATEPAGAGAALGSLFSSIGGLTLETSFGRLNLGDVGHKLLSSADTLLESLESLAAAPASEAPSAEELAARRFRLLALQEDSDTYVAPPADAETFARWRAALAPDELAALRDEVLAHYPAVAAKRAELVPDTVADDAFWAHYLYKAALLAAQEQRGADLLEHALAESDEEVGWGDADSPRRGTGTGASGFNGFNDEEEKPAAAQKPDSASSDGESWIELDERKAAAPPSSSSSGGSAAPPPAPTTTTASSVAEEKKAAPGDDDDDEELDWGDDDIVPDDVLSGDEASGAAASAAAGGDPEEPKKRSGDWGEWD